MEKVRRNKLEWKILQVLVFIMSIDVFIYQALFVYLPFESSDYQYYVQTTNFN